LISAELKIHEGKTLLGRVRNHIVVTDRPSADGGQDLGGTSGELMLLSVGSCAVGNIRDHVERNALPIIFLKADVFVETPTMSEDLGPVVISAEFFGALTPDELRALIDAAGSGRVVRRLRKGTQVDIRVTVCSTVTVPEKLRSQPNEKPRIATEKSQRGQKD